MRELFYEDEPDLTIHTYFRENEQTLDLTYLEMINYLGKSENAATYIQQAAASLGVSVEDVQKRLHSRKIVSW